MYTPFFVSFHDQWKKSIFLTPQENYLEQGISAEKKKIILKDIPIICFQQTGNSMDLRGYS